MIAMGDPKRQRKKYSVAKFAWSKDRLDEELRVLGTYGLRNKRELRHHYATLSKYRTVARQLLTKADEEQAEVKQQLMEKLFNMGLISDNATIDDIFNMSIEDILERRLQTIILRKGLAKTPQQARQLIAHRHISGGGRVLTVPSYIVSRGEESTVNYSPTSPLSDPNHPLKTAPATPRPLGQQERIARGDIERSGRVSKI